MGPNFCIKFLKKAWKGHFVKNSISFSSSSVNLFLLYTPFDSGTDLSNFHFSNAKTCAFRPRVRYFSLSAADFFGLFGRIFLTGAWQQCPAQQAVSPRQRASLTHALQCTDTHQQPTGNQTVKQFAVEVSSREWFLYNFHYCSFSVIYWYHILLSLCYLTDRTVNPFC